MTALTGIAAIVLFLVGMAVSGVVAVARRALATGRDAGRTMRDPALDDLARERAVRAASLAMFACFAGILLRGLCVLAVSAVPVALADAAGVVTAEAVTDWLLRPDVIVVASLVIVLGWLATRRLWPAR